MRPGRPRKFWTLVETQEPPEATDRDAHVISDADTVALAADYRARKQEIAQLERELFDIEDKLKSAASVHALVQIGDMTISKVVRKGAVDYAKVEALKGVNLDLYRKPASQFQTIKLGKAKP